MGRRRRGWFGPHRLHLGTDAGRPSRWAAGLDPGGPIGASRRPDRRQGGVDALPGGAGGSPAVAGRKDDVGSLVVRRCRARGAGAGCPPGKAMRHARGTFPGTAEDGRMDAEAAAQAGIGVGAAVGPVAETDGLGASVSLASSRLAYATRRAAMARNGPHAAPLEPDPASGAAAPLPSPWRLAATAEHGGAKGPAAAGRGRHCAPCARQGAPARAGDAFCGGQPCARPPRPSVPMRRTCLQGALPGRPPRPIPGGRGPPQGLGARPGTTRPTGARPPSRAWAPRQHRRPPRRSACRPPPGTAGSPHAAASCPRATTQDRPSGRRGTPAEATRRSRTPSYSAATPPWGRRGASEGTAMPAWRGAWGTTRRSRQWHARGCASSMR